MVMLLMILDSVQTTRLLAIIIARSRPRHHRQDKDDGDNNDNESVAVRCLVRQNLLFASLPELINIGLINSFAAIVTQPTTQQQHSHRNQGNQAMDGDGGVIWLFCVLYFLSLSFIFIRACQTLSIG